MSGEPTLTPTRYVLGRIGDIEAHAVAWFGRRGVDDWAALVHGTDPLRTETGRAVFATAEAAAEALRAHRCGPRCQSCAVRKARGLA